MSIGVPIKILHEAEGHTITCETTDGKFNLIIINFSIQRKGICSTNSVPSQSQNIQAKCTEVNW